MAIQDKLQEKLLQYRFHALFLAVSAVLFLSLLHLGPSFLTVVSFFWPLLLSTAFFLAAVAVIRLISPPPAEVLGDATGEDLMDYVAGHRPGEEHHEQGEGDKEEEVAEGGAAEEDSKKSQ